MMTESPALSVARRWILRSKFLSRASATASSSVSGRCEGVAGTVLGTVGSEGATGPVVGVCASRAADRERAVRRRRRRMERDGGGVKTDNDENTKAEKKLRGRWTVWQVRW